MATFNLGGLGGGSEMHLDQMYRYALAFSKLSKRTRFQGTDTKKREVADAAWFMAGMYMAAYLSIPADERRYALQKSGVPSDTHEDIYARYQGVRLTRENI